MSDAEEIRRYEEIAHQAIVHWYAEPVELSLLKYRENAVFKVVRDGANDSVIRVHRPGYHNRLSLQSEIAWTSALNAAGINAPNYRVGLAGEHIAELVDTAGGVEQKPHFLCDVIEWVDGEQLGSITGETEISDQAMFSTYRVLGGIAARVHNQSSGWIPPPDFKRHAWNAEGLLGDNPVWGCFWDLEALAPDQIKLLLAARAKLRSALEQLGEHPQYYGLIHADMLPENILVNGNNVNLIDFDDCGFGWHLFEVATSLFFYLGEPIFDPLLEAFVAGYRQHRPMPDEHLAHLPLFFIARGFTYLGWLHTRRATDTAMELTEDVTVAVVELAMEFLDTP